MYWIDVHTHLQMLEDSPEETLRRAKEAGIERVITIGTEPSDHPVVLELARKFYPNVHCTLGIHPHEAKLYTEEVEAFIRTHASSKEVVGIGEIGLDYYYSNSEHDVQKKVFEQQLALSVELGLPVEIHTRDADEDTIQILKKYEGRAKGIIHCFTGSSKLGKACVDMGFFLSFSGIVTFKTAADLRQVVIETPLNQMFVETDAPFLAPIPYRGKKNTPAYMISTAQVVADLKNISLEELKNQTYSNAKRLFAKLS